MWLRMNLISSRRSCGDKGGRGGGKGGRDGSMVGRGGGGLAKRSIVSNEGRGGGGLAVREPMEKNVGTVMMVPVEEMSMVEE
uniref:Uncharacterized protein n=1 Tax=Tanacetum cinerariifolium TaxID=118510 RepID=A0A6L2MQI5_TANCI|nr:hypothetical protein [Tanacetum cinerariifolium]